MTVRERLLTAAAWTFGGSFAATFAFSDVSWHSPWRTIVVQTLANMLFSGFCVAFCTFGLPWVVPRSRRWFAFPLDWVAIILALAVFGAAGSVLATTVGLVLGVIPAARFMAAWYPESLRVSVYFTLIFGISGTLIEELRERLTSTTVALRTKERDEANARRLAVEAQLASLESRVDPHFLFNTLNSIAALVRDQPADAERVIEQLSSLMRSSLDRRAALVPIEEELRVVRSYLEIERVRFGKRLRFRIESPAGGVSPLVPRMSLQTLVENSVKYAVSPSRDGASINVLVTANDGRVYAAVEDDGPGFNAAVLPDGHGLQLLKSRLAIAFGDRATFNVQSRPGQSIVALDLPFETVPPPLAAGVDQPGAQSLDTE